MLSVLLGRMPDSDDDVWKRLFYLAAVMSRSRGRAVAVSAVTGAAAIVLAMVVFVGFTLAIELAQEAWRSLDRSPGCPSSMNLVLTVPQNDNVCLSVGTVLPRGWIVVRPAD